MTSAPTCTCLRIRNPQMSGAANSPLTRASELFHSSELCISSSTNMQIYHGKKVGSLTTSDRSPYIEETRSRLERLSLSPSDPFVPPSPDQLDLEYAQSQPVAAAQPMPPSPIKPKVVFQHRPLEVPTVGNLTQAVTVFEGVTPPKFIDVDADELAGAYDAHWIKRGLANVKSTRSYWQELMTFLHSTGTAEDPENPLTEENAADLMIQFMKNISRKNGMTSKHFMNLVSHVTLQSTNATDLTCTTTTSSCSKHATDSPASRRRL